MGWVGHTACDAYRILRELNGEYLAVAPIGCKREMWNAPIIVAGFVVCGATGKLRKRPLRPSLTENVEAA